MSALLLDCETTGLLNHPTRGHPEIVELAYIKVPKLEYTKDLYVLLTIPGTLYANSLNPIWHHERYKPSMPIHIEATKIHGIVLKDLIGKPKSDTIKLPEDTKYLIGHNIIFDYRCLGKPEGIQLICTYKLIKAYCKFKNEKPVSKKLDDLIKHFFPEQGSLCPKLHNAKLDVIKVILILNMILQEFPKIETWEDLYNFQEGL